MLLLYLESDRHKIVRPCHLKAMPGIVEEANPGSHETRPESTYRLSHLRPGDIEAGDRLKPDGFQKFRHLARVIAGIGQFVLAPVVSIADNQGDFTVSPGA